MRSNRTPAPILVRYGTRRRVATLLTVVAAVVGLVAAAAPAQACAGPPPGYTLSAVSPDHGPTTGGTVATLTGTGFLTGDPGFPLTDVFFGSADVTAFTVNSDTSLTVVAPPQSAGTVYVTVSDGEFSSPYGPHFTGDVYTYDYPFSGFLAPVADPPAVNDARAGQTVSIRFRLGGDQGLGILAPGYPTAYRVDCATGALISPTSITAAAGTDIGRSGRLYYRDDTGTYVYEWKTSETMKGTCQIFVLGLSDGTFHTAEFRFGLR